MNSSNYYKIEEIIKYISNNFKNKVDLDLLAKEFNLSSFYLQKLFIDWVGISPKKFVQYLNLNYLKEKIYDNKSLEQISFEAGLSSQSRIYDLFINFESMTPNEYKNFGQNIKIEYGVHETIFGHALIATTNKGLCNLSFIDYENKDIEINNLKKQWFKSHIEENLLSTKELVNEIFIDNKKVKLFLKGSQFQLKVWEALLKIPEGNLTTYENIAEMIGKPKACRAVGNAIGSNNISYLIPCHRVIRKEINIGNYRWGIDRKKMLIGYEMSKRELG